MHTNFARTALILAALGLAAPAFGDDAWKGDATNNPNSYVMMHTYPTAANYCPAGTQPVLVGGVICCGQPNAPAYVNRAGGVRHTPAPKTHYRAARSYEGMKGVYAPVGEKGVIYR